MLISFIINVALSGIFDYFFKYVTTPWLLLGDFNVAFGAHEKMGLSPIQISYLEFQ